MVGAHIIAPTARCPSFLSSPLESCTRPLPAVAVYRRWYHGGFFVDGTCRRLQLLVPRHQLQLSAGPATFHCSLIGYFPLSSGSAKYLPDDALASTCYGWPVPASSLTRRSQVVVFIRLWQSSLPPKHYWSPLLGHLVFQIKPVSPGATILLRYRYMTASFPLVYRWGKDVNCIVGVLGRLTTRHIIVSRDGRSVRVVKQNPQQGLSAACYARLNTRVSQTNA